MAEILLKIDELNEIPILKIEEAKDKAHLLSQEISDKKSFLDQMKYEVEKLKNSDQGEEFHIQYTAITRQHEAALCLL